ncbi:cAMP-regulated D2 protein-like [Amphiura filiformis]|uniref:cAMP-regulated D2 protein-like n=1 Tax=Amphiura filiformis TaxID=82378 RepID=UPI003B217660
MRIRIGALFIVSLYLTTYVASQEAGPTVDTSFGPVEGVYLNSDGAQAFYGVPFAAPAVGDLRWKAPQDPVPWAPEVRLATENPPGCPQICEGVNPPIDCPAKTSEDCLYMNIFTPLEASPASRLPVLVFLHGGSYYVNSAASPLFDGRYLAAMTSSVVVVPNYRLGALGFLVLNANHTSDDNYLGYGFQDQRHALKFVQTNIENFGGDPGKVTLSGQSVGGECVALHLTLDQSAELFHQAIIQSPPLTLPKASLDKAHTLARLVAEYLNCENGDIECLRSKSADEIVSAQTYAAEQIFQFLDNLFLYFQPWGPVLDRNELSVLDRLATGDFQKKPVVLGGVSEEGRWSAFSFLPTETPKIATLPLYLLLFGVKNTLKVYWKYPINENPDVRDTISYILGDYIWTCSTRKATRDIESHETIPIYHYVFDHAINDSAVWDFVEDWCQDYACHNADLFFLFYTLPLEGFSYTDEEKELAKSLIRFWSNFIHTGNPNTEDWRNHISPVFQSSQTSSIVKHLETPTKKLSFKDILHRAKRGVHDWPPYQASTEWPSMWFKTPTNDILHRYRAKYCNMWDRVGYNT